MHLSAVWSFSWGGLDFIGLFRAWAMVSRLISAVGGQEFQGLRDRAARV